MAKKKTDPISLGVPGHFVNTAQNRRKMKTRDRNKSNKGRRFTNPVQK